MDEKDMYVGDLVIQFPNPDHPDYEDEYDPVNYLDTLAIVKNAFGVFDTSNQKEIQNYKLFEMAFLKIVSRLKLIESSSNTLDKEDTLNANNEISKPNLVNE